MLPGPNTAIKVLYAKQCLSVREAKLACFLGTAFHFSAKRPLALVKAHFFFIIFKIAFMGGVTACKERSGGKPLSILHLLLYVVLLQSQ